MNLYFHHVGQKGAQEDFKKTIYKKRTIDEIEPLLNLHSDGRDNLKKLRTLFPDGEFNCWGVPGGAKSVIKNLKAGDAILLVESVNVIGKVPVLGIVKLFAETKMPELSTYLWGNDNFPFIFFFDTEILTLEWIEFLAHLGYKNNFNPRGNFYKVGDTKLLQFRPIEKYVSLLRSDFGISGNGTNILNEEEYRRYANDNIVDKEFKKILEKLDTAPVLKDDIQSKKVLINKTPRDIAFSLAIKKAYKLRCAISGYSISSPDGKSELQSAHIYPRSLKGSDDLRNGILLTRLLHWAFDCGWISISDDFTVLLKKDMPPSADYEQISKWEGKKLNLPDDSEQYPHPLFLSKHRELHGFE